MRNLIKMERYKLFRDKLYLVLLAGYFILGLTSSAGYKSSYAAVEDRAIPVNTLYDLFNSMAADVLILLVPVGALLALVVGREFHRRNISTIISSWHDRRQILLAKAVVLLPAYAAIPLLFPLGGVIRELGNYSLEEPGWILLNIVRSAFYVWFLSIALFSLAMVFGFVIQNGVVSGIAGMITYFAMMYLFAILAGFGMKRINWCLPLYHMRSVLDPANSFFAISPIVLGSLWIVAGLLIMWYKFRRSDIK